MRQVSQSYKTGELSLVEVAVPRAPSGGVLIETRASLISAGTERTIVDLARKSLLQKARERPDLVAKVLDKVKRDGALAALEAVRSRLDSPIPLGYSLAGVVADVGREAVGFVRGDRVACAGAGYANHAEVNAVPQNLTVHVPDEVSDEEAAFVTVGAIALQGVRLVRPQLGETVVVIGLGLIGQIAASFLTAHGCDVVGVDIDESKVRLAFERGAVAGAVTGKDDLAEVVRAVTDGRGADSVVIAASASNNAPLVAAGEVARDRAVVSVVGLMPLEIPRKPYYEKELQVVVSRSYGPGRYDANYEERGNDYPVGYVRWTERRNLEAVLRAIASKRLDVRGLITHRFAFDHVLDAYKVITGETPEPHLGVILTYEPGAAKPKERPSARLPRERTGPVGIAVVGTGGFATSVLLPRLAVLSSASLVATVSGRGLSAKHAATRFGAQRVAANLDEVLAMDDVEAVVIATRHDSHAALAVKALQAGRHVFIEKPAAISQPQLDELDAAVRASDRVVMVGFNRRFAPFAKEVKALFAKRRAGLMMLARINAGMIPQGHWIHEPLEGGGRIIGEGCHFLDLMSYWAGALPLRVEMQCIGQQGGYRRDDNVILTATFADGSVGTILYTAMGDSSVGKEYYELIAEGKVARIDDWRTLRMSRGGKTTTRHALKADKGHKSELEAFVQACRTGARSPMAWDDVYAVTKATFLEESGRKSSPNPVLTT